MFLLFYPFTFLPFHKPFHKPFLPLLKESEECGINLICDVAEGFGI